MKKQTLYEEITHDLMNCIIYIRRDKKKTKGISALYSSLTEEEETRLLVDGCQRVDPSFEKFGMTDITLWIRTIDKGKQAELMNTNALIAEVSKVRALLATKPDDKGLQDLLARANEKLQQAYDLEVGAQVTDPLQFGVEMMALDQQDMAKWIAFFKKLDPPRSGKITLKHLFEHLEQPLMPLAKEVFDSVDAVDTDGYLEFGDLLRAFCTYCFFGKEEILRFIYTSVDKDRVGYISDTTFVELIESITPYDKIRSRQAMKTINLPAESTVTFEDILLYHETYPALFLQMFLLQDAMREKSLGVDWWFQKLTKYKQVRYKIAKEVEHEEELVVEELQRYRAEKDRLKRIADREQQLKTATGVKKTILEAKQFLDEIG